MKPINGVLYCDYGDMGIYVKGKVDGLHEAWYENGQFKDEANWKDGKLISYERCYDKNGNKIICE